MPSIRLSQTVSATPEQVFAAFTDPAEIRKWHAPGPDFSVPIAQVEPRVGGRYRIGMKPPDREQPYIFGGTYTEFRAPHRIAYTSRWEPPDDPAESSVSIDITASGDGTEVVVVHSDLPDQAAADAHTRGWTGTLESLKRHLG